MLIVTSTFPITVGDAQRRFVFDLARHLTGRFEVHILAPGHPDAARKELTNGMTIWRFTYFWPRFLQRLAYGAGMPANLNSSWLARLQAPFLIVAQVLAVGFLCLKLKPALVNPHWAVPQGLAVAVIKKIRLYRGPVLLSLHAADVHFLVDFAFGRTVARFVASQTNATLAVSSQLAEQWVAISGCREASVSVQSMGVDLRTFGGARGGAELRSKPYFLFVGRFVPKKGLDVLIAAYAQLLKTGANQELLVVGSGPLQADLEAQVQRHALQKNVHFLGDKPHDEVASLMNSSVALVIPSIVEMSGHTEGMPTVIPEAMAARTVVIATKVGGSADVIQDQVNGLLVGAGDTEALANAMARVASSEFPREKILAAANATVQGMSWQTVAEVYDRRLQAIANEENSIC